MKIIISILVLTLFSLSSYCQMKLMDKNYYLHKSKNQKTTGYVLLGSGAALIITGAIIQNKSVKANGAFLNFDGLGYQCVGLVSMLSSIPFFVWSSKNKQKSFSIALLNQKALVPGRAIIAFKSQPALALKINF